MQKIRAKARITIPSYCNIGDDENLAELSWDDLVDYQ